MENTQITHSDSVCFEIFMGKQIKIKSHASLDFLKKSDEKQFFFWSGLNKVPFKYIFGAMCFGTEKPSWVAITYSHVLIEWNNEPLSKTIDPR